MREKKYLHTKTLWLYNASLLCLIFVSLLHSAESWTIVCSKAMQQDEAVRVAIHDLQETGAALGFAFTLVDDARMPSSQTLLVGDAQRNRVTAKYTAQGRLTLQGVKCEQGYEIVSQKINGQRVMVIAGGSLIGDVYGLYWLWDRLRVCKTLPDLQIIREPDLPIRLSLAWGRRGSGGESKAEMQNALRYSINWVSGPAVLDLVPWESEPERSRNEANRNRTRALINYAHALHMNYFSFANEFTFHPSLLEKMSASLSPCDPCFWDALQEKYRSLFRSLPELDGIELCNDDISGFWDDYRAFDVMHERPDCEWPLDLRFRTFVKKIYNVVVNEFDKKYFHFTWSLVAYEQHNQPDIFKKIFTEDVPVKNLYLIPKITAADRWWFQPYNPTFNLTPHQTLVGFETMNYYESSGSHLFPTFPGQYFQAGLQTVTRSKDHNVCGSGYLAGGLADTWDTRTLTAYVLFRLSWDIHEDIHQIARDFCSIHFGAAAAEKMAEICLSSPTAYQYGLHIEPVSYGKFNSFVHIRVGVFPAMGYAGIDQGREHLDFLQEIYLRCKPWQPETFMYLQHGLRTAVRMEEKFREVRPLINDQRLADDIGRSLEMTKRLIATNISYVKTAFAFFAYREQPTPSRRDTLANALDELNNTIEKFKAVPGYKYELYGIEQLNNNAQEMLQDRVLAEARLAKAPTRGEIEKTLLLQQQRYAQVLQEQSERAVKFLHCEVEIDGRDILHIRGDKYWIEHLQWDGPAVKEATFLAPLPASEVTIIPKDIYSRPIHPFIFEQPDANNDYTAKVYLYDAPGGKDWMKFDLYYIPARPEELGMEIPWK